MTQVTIRTAGRDDYADVAAFRWRTSSEEAEVTEGFLDGFVRWMTEHEGAHTCFLAVLDGAIIGMAWLALLPRTPSPGSFERMTGDVQSVLVLPEHRDLGVGSALLAAIGQRGADLGLERITVHSSEAAIPFYRRSGYVESERLLHLWVGLPH